MIDFNFSIMNPTKWTKPLFKDFNIVKIRQLSEHKNFEFQLAQWDLTYIFEFELNTVWWGQDHAGFRFGLAFLGIRMDIQIYDSRHWDFANNQWEIYQQK